MYFVYILKSREKDIYYTGITNDLGRRVKQHNNNNSIGSRGKGPYKLVYYEICPNRIKARQREKYFKSYKFRDNREKILKLWAVSSVG